MPSRVSSSRLTRILTCVQALSQLRLMAVWLADAVELSETGCCRGILGADKQKCATQLEVQQHGKQQPECMMLGPYVIRAGRTGLFMNLRVMSRASGGRVAENTPTCRPRQQYGQVLWTMGCSTRDF